MGMFDWLDSYFEFMYKTSGMSDNMSRETWRNRTYYDNTQPEEKWEGEPKETVHSRAKRKIGQHKSKSN